MPRLVMIEASGREHDLDAEAGVSVMTRAVQAGVEGIEATCGGACSCATCHVYVDEAWFDRLVPPEDMEEAMLEFAEDPQPTSRLSCQIMMTDELDGLTVRVPPPA